MACTEYTNIDRKLKFLIKRRGTFHKESIECFVSECFYIVDLCFILHLWVLLLAWFVLCFVLLSCCKCLIFRVAVNTKFNNNDIARYTKNVSNIYPFESFNCAFYTRSKWFIITFYHIFFGSWIYVSHIRRV